MMELVWRQRRCRGEKDNENGTRGWRQVVRGVMPKGLGWDARAGTRPDWRWWIVRGVVGGHGSES